MTKEDVKNLFALLEIYFPNSPKTRDKRLQSAWLALLEPYSPKDVKAALLERMRENNYFPDPQSIAVKCQNHVKPENGAVYDNFQPSLGRIQKNGEWLEKFLDEHHPGWRDFRGNST